jgi:dedicator of cytokinesis protein 3
VNIKLFHGDKVEDVVQAHPTILHSIIRTNRVGFNDAPFQSRSDIFVTLTRTVNSGPILKLPHSPGYVMVSAEVRLANRPDTVVEKAFFRGTGAGEEAASSYESYVVSNINELSWNERFKLCLPEDNAPKALLVYKFIAMRNATGPDSPEMEPPVAFAAMNLSKEGLFTKDGEHRLKIRRIEPGTTFDQHLMNYILEETALPAPSDPTLCVETFLCSTLFTEDNTLHSLLHWKQDIGQLNSEESKFKLKEILRKFTFVSEIEILKVFPF